MNSTMNRRRNPRATPFSFSLFPLAFHPSPFTLHHPVETHSHNETFRNAKRGASACE